MIHGIGVDFLNINRIKNATGQGDPFVIKVFTEKEIAQANKSRNKVKFFASRFACKEAVYKALKIDSNFGRLNEIEMLSSDAGYPIVNLLGKLKDYSTEAGIISIQLSLSYDNDYVVAYAIAEK